MAMVRIEKLSLNFTNRQGQYVLKQHYMQKQRYKWPSGPHKLGANKNCSTTSKHEIPTAKNMVASQLQVCRENEHSIYGLDLSGHPVRGTNEGSKGSPTKDVRILVVTGTGG